MTHNVLRIDSYVDPENVDIGDLRDGRAIEALGSHGDRVASEWRTARGRGQDQRVAEGEVESDVTRVGEADLAEADL